MKAFSKKWTASANPRKQRKYVYNAPLHIRKKLLKVHLSKDLREKHSKRSLLVRTGDTVKALTGSFKGKTGKVTKVSYSGLKVYVDAFKVTKADGKEVQVAIHPSNIQIEELDLSDEKRKASLERK